MKARRKAILDIRLHKLIESLQLSELSEVKSAKGALNPFISGLLISSSLMDEIRQEVLYGLHVGWGQVIDENDKLSKEVDIVTYLGKPRTIRNTLEHVGFVEWWYITRLDVELPTKFPKDVFELLSHTRKIVVDHLQNFPKEKRSGVFQPKKDVGRKAMICNLWSARKVLRRLVDHERLHTKYIEKILQMYNS